MSLAGLLALPATCLLLGLFLPGLARAQGQSVPQNPVGTRHGTKTTVTRATSQAIEARGITVVVTDEKGQSLAATSKITISSNTNNNSILKSPTREGDVWVFQDLPEGDEYVVEVDTPGYESGLMFVTLGTASRASRRVEFPLRLAGSRNQLNFNTSHLLLGPLAKRELQRGMKALRSNNARAARKHLEIVLESDPSNAPVNYLVGLTYLLDNRGTKAAPYLEKAMASDPKQVAALVTLGAIHLLTRALQQDPGFWQAHWILAEPNLQEGKYAEARDHAEVAFAGGKGKAAQAQLIVGGALAGLGKFEDAAALERYTTGNAADTQARQARGWARKLREPATAAATAKEIIAEVTEGGAPRREAALSSRAFPPHLFLDRNWMPPDVDAVAPPVTTDKACPLSSILKKAGKGMEQFITDLENFSATEKFQLARVSGAGQVGIPLERKFDYLLIVDRPRPHLFVIEVMRNRQFGLPNMGVPIMDAGSAALALAFHPNYRGDFEWRCEGLGTWKDKPAWVIHFAQRSDRPTSRLEGFVTLTDVYPLPMKGRAWLMEKTGRILHLEADLMNPLKPVQLEREHFSVSYKEVAFTRHAILWLPEDVNSYIEYQGHRYHQYHHFSHFVSHFFLFRRKIREPKE